MNPYEVLGVPEGADEETIKRAYKELVKKYHPDKYVNNPLADLASEKLKEVNKAYDMLTNKSGSSGSYGGGYSGGYSGGSYSGSGQSGFRDVRMLINMRNYASAMAMLNSLPHTAEWNYLMGLCKINTGMYDAGINFIRTAVSMDPTNAEYRATLNNIENRNTTYRQYNTGSSCMGDPCSCCTNLICADCCCECMGGDLISCC
ncbi:MAG: J domain-containing protein [Clostridia bacterium]|nr:J domain-containing protein [Clostridia bacterium]